MGTMVIINCDAVQPGGKGQGIMIFNLTALNL